MTKPSKNHDPESTTVKTDETDSDSEISQVKRESLSSSDNDIDEYVDPEDSGFTKEESGKNFFFSENEVEDQSKKQIIAGTKTSEIVKGIKAGGGEISKPTLVDEDDENISPEDSELFEIREIEGREIFKTQAKKPEDEDENNKDSEPRPPGGL